MAKKPAPQISRSAAVPATDQAAGTPPASASQEGSPTTTTATDEDATVASQAEGEPLPSTPPQTDRKDAPLVDPHTGLRLDGPTPQQWADAGYDPAKYPPQGYAPKVNAVPPHLASSFRSELPGGGFRAAPSQGQPSTIRSHKES